MEDVVSAAIFQICEAIITATPIDTGRARGGWVPSIDKIKIEETNPDKTGARTVARVKLEAEKASGSIFYLINNVYYIAYLEHGSSGQAPQGMIKTNVLGFRAALRKALNEHTS